MGIALAFTDEYKLKYKAIVTGIPRSNFISIKILFNGIKRSKELKLQVY
jgi:hypothetical protein